MRLNQPAAFVAAFLLLCVTSAGAQLSFHDPVTSQGILDQVIAEFAARAAGWKTIIMNAALWLFWTLGTISLVWTGGMMILRKGDVGDFFAEFFRFIMFFGFFLWLLRYGPDIADAIIRSLRQLGETAIGVSGLSPSGIVDVGFMIWKQAITNLSVWSPIDSLVGVVLSAGILTVLAIIAINMLLLLVSGWVLMYAGIFFLGFGGSRWTSDMAINYYKTVLGVAAQLFAMVLIVGIGNDMLTSFYAKMTKSVLNFEELGVMLVFCLALLLLANRLPALIGGIVTGASVGGAGIGQYGAANLMGAAMGAAGMAASAASMAGAAVMSGANNLAGGASAIKAAFEKAQGTIGSDSGAGEFPTMSSDGGTGQASDAMTAGTTPFAEAAGLDGGPSTNTSISNGANIKAKDESCSGEISGRNVVGKAANSSTDGSQGRHLGGARSEGRLSRAASLTASAASELTKGAGSVLKSKATQLASGFQDGVAQTFGGQVASAIKTGDTPAFDGNSISGNAGQTSSPDDEVAAFVNRPTPT